MAPNPFRPKIDLGIGGALEGAGSIIGGALSGAGSAIGGAAQGLGSAVGGALQGALTEGPKTIVNNVGIAGSAGKQNIVSGTGTLPAPKKVAKPTYNEKMPTEKLLAVAVSYLASIDSTLRTQIENDRLVFQKKAQAEKEAAVEGKNGESIFNKLGAGLGAAGDYAKQKSSKWDIAGTLIKGGLVLGAIGAIGVSQLDKSELAELKTNMEAFKKQFEGLTDTVKKIYDFIGSEGVEYGTIGSLFGIRGGIVGLIMGTVEHWTGSKWIGGAAGVAAGALLYSGAARRAAGRAILRGAATAAANPAAIAAGGATLALVVSVDQMFKGIQTGVNASAEKFEQAFGLYVESFSKEGFTRKTYKIKMPVRGINYRNVPAAEIHGDDHQESERFYFWNRVHIAATDTGNTGPAAKEWIKTKGQAWLDKHYPIKTNATPVTPAANTNTPNAAPEGGSTPTGGEVSSVPQTAYDVVWANGAYGDPQRDAGKLLSQMTVDEVLAFQKNVLAPNTKAKQGTVHTPVGAYQFVYDTLKGYRDSGVVSGSDMFNAQTQDKLAKTLWNASKGGDMSQTWAYTAGSSRGQFANTDFESVKSNIISNEVGSYVGMTPSGPASGNNPSIIESALEIGKKIFGKAGAALIGTQNYTSRPITEKINDPSIKILDMSKKIETAMINGKQLEISKPGVVAATAAQQSIMQASNDGTLGALDPNYQGGMDTVKTYLAHWKFAA